MHFITSVQMITFYNGLGNLSFLFELSTCFFTSHVFMEGAVGCTFEVKVTSKIPIWTAGIPKVGLLSKEMLMNEEMSSTLYPHLCCLLCVFFKHAFLYQKSYVWKTVFHTLSLMMTVKFHNVRQVPYCCGRSDLHIKSCILYFIIY